jgi:transaldolase
VRDVENALDLLEPVHEGNAEDGYVSIEVDPTLAFDTKATYEEAIRLHEWIDRPNLYVKIPGTEPGLQAIEDCIAGGRSINVTLLFSLQRHKESMEAYLSGLERFVGSGGDASRVRSVASFFVSRVDTEADKRLEAIGSDEALALRGKLAIANARIAYQNYREAFSGPRWEALGAKGALPQRCLWASTSTKNPEYRDVLYVEELIGPHTVNTMPEETIQAFQDHGEVRGDTVLDGVDEAHALLEQLAAVGIDYGDVVATLEQEGVQKFSDSFAELLDGVRAKREAVAA